MRCVRKRWIGVSWAKAAAAAAAEVDAPETVCRAPLRMLTRCPANARPLVRARFQRSRPRLAAEGDDSADSSPMPARFGDVLAKLVTRSAPPNETGRVTRRGMAGSTLPV